MLPFVKLHGAGNDYIAIDGRGIDRDWGELSVAMSRRNFGVGSDGITLVQESDLAQVRMRIYNPDGSIQGSGLVIGGNKSLLANYEYIFMIANPVRILFFYDAGQVANFGQQFSNELWKTSTGGELRFFMPVLNIPFRLIYAWNPNVKGILNDRFQPQESTVFKFAVGTTF